MANWGREETGLRPCHAHRLLRLLVLRHRAVMRGIRRGALIVLWLVLCGLSIALVPGAAPLSAASGSFLETFDGSPGAPTPWRPATWDVTVHSRDVGTFATLESMHAGHGSDCSAPPAEHNISSYDDAVFVCRDHVMTAIKAGGYGLIYLTPNQLVDFGAGEAVVKFDVSTLRTSQRDWIDLWITPFNENLQFALDEFLPDGNGNPRNAIHLRMDNFGGGSGSVRLSSGTSSKPSWRSPPTSASSRS